MILGSQRMVLSTYRLSQNSRPEFSLQHSEDTSPEEQSRSGFAKQLDFTDLRHSAIIVQEVQEDNCSIPGLISQRDTPV
jgi:hypothetical protein